MKLKEYLTKTKQKPLHFAKKHDIPMTNVWRAFHEKPVGPKIAAAISEASGNKVKRQELLYPEK
jgi:hypothetical protein